MPKSLVLAVIKGKKLELVSWHLEKSFVLVRYEAGLSYKVIF